MESFNQQRRIIYFVADDTKLKMTNVGWQLHECYCSTLLHFIIRLNDPAPGNCTY